MCDEGQWKEFLQVDDSGEFVTQVLELFVAQAGQLASRLPNLAGDPEVLASEAHKLKGAAANVGATRAAYFCEIVENAAKLSHPFLDQRAVTDLKESLVLTVNDYQKRLKIT